MMARFFVLMTFLGLDLLSSGGCSRNLRKELARGSTDTIPSKQHQQPSPLNRDLTYQAPLTVPQPPLPPPLPTEPVVAPPQSRDLATSVPLMPNGGPVEPISITPVSATVVATPEADDDKKPILERIKERRKERQERREEQTQPPATPTTPTTPPTKPTAPTSPQPTTRAEGNVGGASSANADLTQVKRVLDASVKRYATMSDYECRLIKREVVNNKQLPTDEIQYRFRKAPLSVYMKVLSESGQGREVLYVKGQFGDKMHVITGKGDNVIVGAGYKTELEPDSKMATAKSRYRIYEAGFGRTLTGLEKAIQAMEANPKASAVKSLGLVTRKEYEYALEGVEITLKPGEEHMLEKGGKRQLFFDPKPDSPSYMMPVLSITTDAAGKEVEYYCFDKLKTPSGWKDADWNPANLGKKK